MMKRLMQCALACALVLSLAAVATAQAPTPMVRMGDWNEIADDVFMNFLFSNTIEYRGVHNKDFEDDLKDRHLGSGANSASSLTYQSGDHMVAENRFGWDMRYKKNLSARMLFEVESVYDGSHIDGSGDNGDAAIHVERFWIDYKYPNTPFRMRVGAWLWNLDEAREVFDDDPGIHFFLEWDQFQAWVAIIIEEDSTFGPSDGGSGSGNQLETNDNDHIRYMLALRYKTGPHSFCLCVNYERDRNRDIGSVLGVDTRTHHDYAVVHLGWNGRIGPVTALLQGDVGFGTAEAQSNGDDFDIFTWGVVAAVELDAGIVHPILGIVVGSADDDIDDGDLNGYNPTADNEITNTPYHRIFNVAKGAVWHNWTGSPAQSPILGGPGAGNTNVPSGHHTVDSIFNDAVVNVNADGATGGVVASPLANAGTLSFMAALRILPAAGHEIGLWYIYLSMLNSDLVEDLTGENIDKHLYHEIGLMWTWTINKHFDVRPRGVIVIPGSGAKDIAETEFTCGNSGTDQCEGEDIQLVGEVRFRARF